jgi:ABC-type glycerol-3-phosphate transport system substrate-binding protein
MPRRIFSLIIPGLILFLMMVSIGACQRANTPETSTITTSYPPTQSEEDIASTEITSQTTQKPNNTIFTPETEKPYPQPSNQDVVSTIGANLLTAYPPVLPTQTQPLAQQPLATQTQPILSLTPSATYSADLPYPAPGGSSNITPIATQPNPRTQITTTPPPYPGPATSATDAVRTPTMSSTANEPINGTQISYPTPELSPGALEATPTELPPPVPLSPPPAGSSITIWHSWGAAETEKLQEVIQSFKRLFPDVTFKLIYIPLDDLLGAYQAAAYFGQGPSLLLGPSNWGPVLYEASLIADLGPFIPDDYLRNVNSNALASGNYHKALISLPLSQRGMVMFRNTAVISKAPSSFDELIKMSQQVTHGGVVGTYLERGSYFSAPNIIGLGGNLIDSAGNPAFNDTFGLEWLDLLTAFDEAGAVTFNTNRDLEMFMRGRVGIIIDWSMNISMLARAIGMDNLAIDPWPTFGTGHLTGWMEADSIYLNANASSNDRFAALTFIGYLLDPNVQMHLAEVGHIPSVLTTQPRDRLIQEAMIAISDGVPYPNSVDSDVLSVYWNELDMAIRNVFERGVDPASAIKVANINIIQVLQEMRIEP